ncbi:MAG: Brp/Blh family beta-carotene 15,15'-dioxygenase [Spirosomataceae bacterium]
MGAYTKYYILIILPLLILAWSEWIGFEEMQVIGFLLVGVWVTGIPHGGLDHLVAKKSAQDLNQPFSILSFLVKYLGRMVIFGLIWLISPVLGLLGFICLSALHFGEIDLQYFKWPHQTLYRVFAFAYGVSILGGLFLTHLEEVNTILHQFPFVHGWDTLYRFLVSHEGVIEAMGITTILIGLLWLGAITNQWKAAQHSISILLVWWLILWRLPLLMGFAVYFCCWHAILTFMELKNFMGFSWIQLSKKAIPFSLIALVGIFALIGIFWYFNHPELLWPVLFIGIALLTAPHGEVMDFLFLRRRVEN